MSHLQEKKSQFMNHLWNKLDDKNSVCVRCGCERELENVATDGFFQSYFVYVRNGQIFTDRPDCVDWNKENLKTID